MRRHARLVFAAVLLLFLTFSAFGPTPSLKADSDSACRALTNRYRECVDRHGYCARSCQAISNVLQKLDCGGASSSTVGGGCSESSQ